MIDYTGPGDTDETPILGTVFVEKYRIEELIGEGGMGTVYRAQQLNINRPVAIKTLHGSLLGQEAFLRRFSREARAASRLSSPHVVRVYDFGLDEPRGIPFIVMELLKGDNLFEAVSKQGVFSASRTAQVCLQIARALVDAEEAGIVHRDMKPENIFLGATPDGGDFAKVMDFGVARLSPKAGDTEVAHNTSSVIVGTPKYMAPEQIRGENVGPKADLYALGCLLHYMLTGRPPFERDDNFAIMEAHLKAPIPALPERAVNGESIPASMVDLYFELMAKNPRGRPSGARAALRKLSRVEDDIRKGLVGSVPSGGGNQTQIYGSSSVPTSSAPTPSHDLSGGIADTNAGPSLAVAEASHGDASAFATTAAGPSLSDLGGTSDSGDSSVDSMQTVAAPSLVVGSLGNRGDSEAATAMAPALKVDASAPAGLGGGQPPASVASFDEASQSADEAPTRPRVQSQTIVDFNEAFPNKNRQLVGIALGFFAVIVVGFAFVFSPGIDSEAPQESTQDLVEGASKPESLPEEPNEPVLEPKGSKGEVDPVGGEVPEAEEKAEMGRVKVLVESEPVGAEVRRNGILLGKTPMELNPEKSQGAFKLNFALEGYLPMEKELDPASGASVRALLTPRAARAKKKTSRARKASRIDKAPARTPRKSGASDKIDTMLD